MCGILGFVGCKTGERNLKKLLTTLRHRGPDDQGIFVDEYVMLGHTRLSILDLSQKGKQPMISDCGNFVIVYNGEIYNFKEIKQELSDKGYIFHSNTDTEVVLKSFIEYREKLVEKLDGMFAFAVYDKKQKIIFLARDRHGIKPLYYYWKPPSFMFSSELKAIDIPKNVELKGLILFLLFGYVVAPYTIYKNIYEFPADHYGIFDIKSGNFKLHKYSFFNFLPNLSISYKEACEKLEDLLKQSVKKHLISDVPVGVFLSGGLDSSLITALSATYVQKLNTFSLIFEEKEYTEVSFQKRIVEKYNTNHHTLLVTRKTFLECVDELFNSMEQPTVDGLNTFLVSHLVKKHGIKVVLSGLGGDELFYGYNTFKRIYPLLALSSLKLHHLFKLKWKKLNFLKNSSSPLHYYLVLRGIFTPEEISSILDISLEEIWDIITEIGSHYKLSDEWNWFDKIAFIELSIYMRNQLLRDSDLFSMYHSLELRVPLLSFQALTDFSLKLPVSFKLGRVNKKILSTIGLKYLPKEIIFRKKQGFSLPYENWLRDEYGWCPYNFNRWFKNWALIVLKRKKFL